MTDKLKAANVSIHVITTGAGAGIQQKLWATSGCSAYFSGASFPYDSEETESLLGFMPTQFVSKETAIDLASAAYMKAYRFGGKKAVGVGVTASVASTREHRGDHRFYVCVMTEDQVRIGGRTIEKGVGEDFRADDGRQVDTYVHNMLTLIATKESGWGLFNDETDLAKARFFEHPFFAASGKRMAKVPQGAETRYAMMPGSFNPPHEGHFGLAESFRDDHGKSVLFEIGTNPPHKTPPTVQELLQRAKMLKGHDVLFSRNMPMYIEKAAMFHGMDFIVGADTMLRILDPKWGPDPIPMMEEIGAYGNDFYISGREVNGKFITRDDIVDQLIAKYPGYDMSRICDMTHHIEGRWDVSSTELRNKVK